MTIVPRGCLVTAGLLMLAIPLPAREPPATKDKDSWKSLFDGKTLDGWKAADFTDAGKVHVKDGAIVMDKGASMTGVAYTGNSFPKIDYEVSLDGQRVAGGDFFC